jgi:hypothetical protein
MRKLIMLALLVAAIVAILTIPAAANPQLDKDGGGIYAGSDCGAGAGRSVTTIVIRHPALASTCKLAFEAVWERGLELEQARKLITSRRVGSGATTDKKER